MKKILIFSLAYYPKHVGGAEVAIKEITDRLGVAEYEFHMVTNRFDSSLPKVSKEGNVVVHRIGIAREHPGIGDLRRFPLLLNKPLFQFLAAWKGIQLHQEHHFDALWAMMAHSCGVPAVLFSLVYPKTPYILTLQEGDPVPYIEKKMKPLWPLFVRAFTRAKVVQAISTYLADWARERGAKGVVEVVPNGVDTKQFTQHISHSDRLSLRKKFTSSDTDVLLVTTSRLVTKNAVDDVIRALSLLPSSVRFVVYGEGPDGPALEELAQKLGVSERVYFEGFLDHADMPKRLKTCDIFIRPSRSEGMGNSFIEAMVAGLPVVATQEGGIADFLFDAKKNPDKPTTGWAVDKNSPEQIAEAIKSILSDPAQTTRTVENARNLACTQYSWEKVAKKMEEKVFGAVLTRGV